MSDPADVSSIHVDVDSIPSPNDCAVSAREQTFGLFFRVYTFRIDASSQSMALTIVSNHSGAVGMGRGAGTERHT